MSFDDNALVALHAAEYKLCSICGDALGTRKIFGHASQAGLTTGSGMHPRCALLSYHYCPYLREVDKSSADAACFDMVDSDCCGLELMEEEDFTPRVWKHDDEDADDQLLYDLTEVHLRPGYQTLLLSELCALARTDPTGTTVAPFHEVQALASGKSSRKQRPAHERA